jgi:hypothetical protein
MEKRISYSQFQQVKSAAKMMDPNMRKIESLMNKIKPLEEEIKTLQSLNNALEEGIVKVIGVPVYQLVKKVIEPTGAVGKDGKPIKVTKYLPTDAVSYDEQKKQYVIQIADDEKTIVPPTTENVAGSDFDKDAEALEIHEEESEKEAAEQEASLPWNN